MPIKPSHTLIVLCLALAGCREGEAPPSTRVDYKCTDCNLIIISVDTLRADRLSTYGYERQTSPNLSRFAEEGVLFENFMHSGGGTLPSHMSLMTSLYPFNHRVDPNSGEILQPERITLAERLKDAGYATAGFTDGGWMSGKFGFEQGFDTFDDRDVNGHLQVSLPKVYDWLEEHSEDKFFLFLHTYDVHSKWKKLPYDCPDGYAQRYTADYLGDFDGCQDGKCASVLLQWFNQQIKKKGGTGIEELLSTDDINYISSLYDGCINYVDERLAELFLRLRESGIYDKSLIVFTSDHGEEFLEHGMLIHNQGAYEELGHVPLIMKFPRSNFGNTKVPHLATMVDVMPTILDVLDVPQSSQAQGTTLMPTILEQKPVHQAVHMYDTLRTARWKYIPRLGELYDLDSDPLEERNVFQASPGVVARLERRLQKLIREDQARREEFLARVEQGAEGMELTEEEIKNLKSLGYLN